MAAAGEAAGGDPHVPEVIRPGPDAEKSLDLAADVQRKKEKLPSPTERYEARVDSYIAELKRDKQQLQEEVNRLRTQEIPRLTEDVRRLEDRLSWQGQQLIRTRTAYASAAAFSWFSFALIAIGGCAVSYATFMHPGMQLTIATVGAVALLIGVALQVVNARVGKRHYLQTADSREADAQPRPNPRPGDAHDVRPSS